MNKQINWDELQRKYETTGAIIVCPNCGKIDIHPLQHKEECNPSFQQYLDESRDNEWK